MKEQKIIVLLERKCWKMEESRVEIGKDVMELERVKQKLSRDLVQLKKSK